MPIKVTDLQKYEWFVAYLLAASEKILASVEEEVLADVEDKQKWIETIELNISYHEKFLSDKNALSDDEFESYDEALQKLILKKTSRAPPPPK